METVCETERLRLSQFSLDDAAFVVRLLNEPSFIRHVGDKGVRTIEDAQTYLSNGPLASYAQHGFGLCRVALQATGQSIGMCGLIRRKGLEDVDIGYAFLPEFCSQGYAAEAARGVLQSAARDFGLRRVVAVVNPDNTDSIGLLEKVGFRFERMVLLEGEAVEIKLFAKELTTCQRLTVAHAPQYRALMLEAYAQHPDAFTSTVAQREALPLAWWEARLHGDLSAGEVVFGVFQGGHLAGVVGMSFDAREKARHKATLFGMFVPAQHRQLGLGRMLVDTALDYARGRPFVRQVLLTVTKGNASAQALYERCGFETFGVEPDAVAVGSSFVSKVHMWCRLDRPHGHTPA